VTPFRERCQGRRFHPHPARLTLAPKIPRVIDPYLSEAGKHAYAFRRGSSTEERIEAARRWAAVFLEKQIRDVVAAAPELTAEQRMRLALLFSDPTP
jgi:hypothetical protein